MKELGAAILILATVYLAYMGLYVVFGSNYQPINPQIYNEKNQ